MTDTEAALFAHLERQLAKAQQIRDKAQKVMITNATKHNLDRMLEYLAKLTGGAISLEVMLYEPTHEYYSMIDREYRISVFYDTIDPEMITEIVQHVYPYIVRRFRRKPDNWDGLRVFDLVSKARFLSEVKKKDSPTEEDNVMSAETYLLYLLRNDVLGARAKYSAPKHLKSDDWRGITKHHCFDHINPQHRQQIWSKYDAWYTEYRRSLWCNLHGRLLDLSVAFAPLRQLPYTLLWILDWLRPMSFQYWNDGTPYDPNHLRKLRLFERVATSYEMIVTSRAASTDAGAR